MSSADVIVSSDDTSISMAGGVSKSILDAGGESIRQDAHKMLPAQIGDVVVSSAGEVLCQKYIFHSLTLDYERKKEGDLYNSPEVQDYILQHTVDKCFALLHALDLKSIAFPCIGAGRAMIPLVKIATVMADAIAENLCGTQKSFEVELYLYDRFGQMDTIDYLDLFESFAAKSALSQQKSQVKLEEKPSVMAGTKSFIVPRREDMTHDIFVSYSRSDEDKEKVAALRGILDKTDFSYWIDVDGIYSGENYKEVIEDAIETATVVIFVSSYNSNKSQNVIREIGYAVGCNKVIVPVLLDDSQYARGLRMDLRLIDQIDFSDPASAEQRLCTSLKYALGNARTQNKSK